MRRPLGLPFIKLVEMSYNLQSRTEYGVSDRAQIHPRAALAPARPDHAHDPKPRTRPRPTVTPRTLAVDRARLGDLILRHTTTSPGRWDRSLNHSDARSQRRGTYYGSPSEGKRLVLPIVGRNAGWARIGRALAGGSIHLRATGCAICAGWLVRRCSFESDSRWWPVCVGAAGG